jgi:hypothetical protein
VQLTILPLLSERMKKNNIFEELGKTLEKNEIRL